MTIQRTYNVPLRREFLRSPRYKRAKKAIIALRKFLQKHMKSEDVLIGRKLNELVWLHGIKNPPHHVKVDVVKEDDGRVYAELSGFKYEKPAVEDDKKGKAELKKEAKKGEGIIKEELEKLEEKTEKIKEVKEKKGEEKEKKLEDLSKHEGKIPPARGKTTVEMTEKKKKERSASSS